jgi:hypothetical protein
MWCGGFVSDEARQRGGAVRREGGAAGGDQRGPAGREEHVPRSDRVYGGAGAGCNPDISFPLPP